MAKTPALKPGALFQKDARSLFMELTRSRYSGIVARHKKLKYPPPPFSLEDFREHCLAALGGRYDGAVLCRYCRHAFTIEECAADHMRALARGGDLGLQNIDFPCKADNDRKGQMYPEQYLSLLAFLEDGDPFMRRDVLSRLQKAVSLAAGARRNAALIGEVRAAGNWPQRRKKAGVLPANTGLGEF